MPTPAKQPIPEGMHSITPHLVCQNALDAMAFYVKAFDAIELVRLLSPEGKLMHGLMKIGDSTIMLMETSPEWNALDPHALKGTPITIHLYVKDVDASFAQASAAGGKAIMPPADMFWGDRYSIIEDPAGHRWSIASHTRDMTQAEIEEGMKSASCGQPET